MICKVRVTSTGPEMYDHTLERSYHPDLPLQCLHCLEPGKKMLGFGMDPCIHCMMEGHKHKAGDCHLCRDDPLVLACEDWRPALCGVESVVTDHRQRTFISGRQVVRLEVAWNHLGTAWPEARKRITDGIDWMVRRHQRRWIERGIPQAECTPNAIIGSALAIGRLETERLFNYVPGQMYRIMSIDPEHDRPAPYVLMLDGRWLREDTAIRTPDGRWMIKEPKR